MDLYIKQKIFSLWGKYTIFHEDESIAYTVKGKAHFGHKLVVYDANKKELGMVKQKIFSLLATYRVYEAGQLVGTVKQKFSLIHPKYKVDYKGWNVDGSWTAWNYRIIDQMGNEVATIKQNIWRLHETYHIHIAKDSDTLPVLMFVLTMSSVKKDANAVLWD